MLILMGGLPKSGKTVFAKALAFRLGASLISPDVVLPPGLEQFSEEKQKELRIAAWKACQESTLEFCSKPKNVPKVAIFDTTGKNLRALEELERMCSIRGHDLFFVYVHDTRERCGERGVGESLLNEYFEVMKAPLQHFKNRLVVVKNEGSVEDLIDKAPMVEELCRSASNLKIPMTLP